MAGSVSMGLVARSKGQTGERERQFASKRERLQSEFRGRVPRRNYAGFAGGRCVSALLFLVEDALVLGKGFGQVSIPIIPCVTARVLCIVVFNPAGQEVRV